MESTALFALRDTSEDATSMNIRQIDYINFGKDHR